MKLEIFLSELNIRASKLDLKIVVIRNNEKLPYQRTGNDIDVIIKNNDLNLWLSVIERLCKDNNINYEIRKKYYYCTKLYFPEVDGGLELDLNNRFEWRGVEFYSTEKLINASKLLNQPIYTGGEHENNYITLHHSLLYGGFLNEKYNELYLVLVHDYYDWFYGELSNLLGVNNALYIINEIRSNNSIPRSKINKMRVTALKRSLMKSPLKTTVNLVKSLYYDKV